MKSFLLIPILLLVLGSATAQDRQVEFTSFQLSDTVYMLKGAGGNIGVSAGEDGLYLIDDQLRPVTAQLLQALRKISDQPVSFVINTHYHADHTGGNETVGKNGAVIIAHNNIRQRMISAQISTFMHKTTPPYAKEALPVVTFNDQMSLHLNGETATAYYVAHGHTDGDSIIHFPVSNVIHMGDMYFNGLYPYVDLDAGGSIEGMVDAANLALTMTNETTQVIPGHGPLATTKDLKAYRDFLVKAIANVQTLIDEGLNLQQIIAAKPTAEWDEEQGKVWIKPAEFVTFIYNSLEGIGHFTPPKKTKAESD